MKRKILFILVGVSVIVLFSLLFNQNYLFFRRPYRIARKQSKLNISSNIKIFEEKYSFTGEGFIFIVFDLTEQELKSLILSCKKRNYKKLTVDNLIKDGFLESGSGYGIRLYNKDIRKIKYGYYLLEARNLNSLDFGITVLDIKNKELIIYIIFP